VENVFKDPAMKEREAAFLGPFEAVSDGVAKSVGFDSCPWFLVTQIVLFLYFGMTILVCFYRPDFINITICVVALYMVNEPSEVKKWTFRLLVLGIFLSLVFDVVFFVLNDYSNEKQYDGGAESGVRHFSMTMSYVSFFFRVSVA
jgi:hypothetical protein